ncbi:hypothetical protein EV207_12559 [Scopulibacillus darangshiensis]|uniref:Uncharacterized protein n=1 Tax=Scopulibacillus darangshiensis TaxID=442528 RepID=A0A4R2NST5_9BACL|nr:hypothetical protein [Scopulibacillus darangshiensis]TCP24498.1 hypothetical protein EV207_12559 [Scopulibacillus darangshiensis]
MEIESLNWYEMIVEAEGSDYIENYRTKQTLDELKRSRRFEGFEGIQESAKWNHKGSGMFIKARVMESAAEDISIVQEFNKNSKTGTKGHYTINELEGFDLVDVSGYGIVDNFLEFKRQYEVEVAKK